MNTEAEMAGRLEALGWERREVVAEGGTPHLLETGEWTSCAERWVVYDQAWFAPGDQGFYVGTAAAYDAAGGRSS